MSDRVLRLTKFERRVPTGALVKYADWILYNSDKDSLIGLYRREALLEVPLRANLHKFLVGLLLDWDWKFEGDIPVTEEQARYLKTIFENQREYNFWKKGLKIVSEQGKEKAWEWVKEKIPVLKLKNVLEE